MTGLFALTGALFTSLGIYIFFRMLMRVPGTYTPPQGERGVQFEAAANKLGIYRHVHQIIWFCSRCVGMMIPQPLINRYNHSTQQAGSPGGLNGIEFLTVVPLSAVLCGLFGSLLSVHISGKILTGMGLGFAGGALLPFARLDQAISQRKHEILVSLPYAIDLLALCMRAGQTFHGALATVTKEMAKGHALKFELEYMRAQIKLGASTTEALNSMAHRIHLIEIHQFVQSAIRAHQKGSSLADIFSIQATIIRTRRSERAEQTASRAAVAMLGPLMLIFLTVFVLLLGPFGVKAWYGTLM